jgi:hypothetical protein
VPNGSKVGYVYQCGTATATNTGYMYNALRTGAMMTASGGAFYLFHSPTEALKALPDTQFAKGQNGATVLGTGANANFPQYTAVVEDNGIITLNQSQLTESTTHEEGHWVTDLGGGYVGLSQEANYYLFTSNLAVDWQNVNSLAGCAADGSGILNGQADPAKYNPAKPNAAPYYVCLGATGNEAGFNAGESGSNNQAVIQRLYGGIYNNGGNGNGEIYAEGFAASHSSYYNDTIFDPAHFMYAGFNPILFSCTINISTAMWNNQALPTTWPPNGGYVPCVEK